MEGCRALSQSPRYLFSQTLELTLETRRARRGESETPRGGILKQALTALMLFVDILLLPFLYPAAFLLKSIRRAGIQRFPLCKNGLLQVGVFPIRDHYHEPLFDSRHLSRPLSEERYLPGIDWNTEGQLALLAEFTFAEELKDVPKRQTDNLSFYLGNGSFESGDAEYWYSLIRLKAPSRIIEIGSGHSTLMAKRAIARNKQVRPGYDCDHICIEPFERPWLEGAGVNVIRNKVENVDRELFTRLRANDVLFIDSSHVIRPQGDVLLEYLELLPSLSPGVIVHVHDIFSPRDYLSEWVRDRVYFWNEQYLLEAFLTSNSDWKIIGALNYLHHHHYPQLRQGCPHLTSDREPGSFYLQRIAHS